MRLRLFADEAEVATGHVRVSVPMATALVCAEADCQAVYDAGPPHTCPRCGCAEAVPLANSMGHNRPPSPPGEAREGG